MAKKPVTPKDEGLPNAVVANQGEASTGVREPKTEKLPNETVKVTY